MTDAPSQTIARDDAAVPSSLMGDAEHLGSLGADTAHELANLMTVVSGSLEQLRRQPLSEKGRQQLARAEWGVRQAARLTRQMVSQASGEKDALAVVDLNAVVGGFAAVMGQQFREDVQLAAELAQGHLPVRLDAGLLELVLLNLVRNAADAMPEGGQVVLLTKGPRLDGLGDQLAVEVAVADTGMGMASDVAQHATEAFFTTKSHGKGTGLGLWMAHRFVSTHGGKISIETAPGQGTTVRLSLPYAGDAEPG
jgi:signal transduction histidine kinase